jgi:thioredoxin reductase
MLTNTLSASRLVSRQGLRLAAARSVRLLSTAPEPYDVIVIGGGPGGYPAAIKAGQLGMRVACVEKRGTLGGTCLNVGCIPSKALLHSSHLYEEAAHGWGPHGISADNVKMDLDKLMQHKAKTVSGLTGGIEGLFKKYKVDYYKGAGEILAAGSVKCHSIDGTDPITLSTKDIVIATGSEPASLPNVPVDEKSIVTSTGALELSAVPKKMIVIGAGVIGLEMGSVWRRLGAEVTVVEFLDRITPGMDDEVAKTLQRLFKKREWHVHARPPFPLPFPTRDDPLYGPPIVPVRGMRRHHAQFGAGYPPILSLTPSPPPYALFTHPTLLYITQRASNSSLAQSAWAQRRSPAAASP